MTVARPIRTAALIALLPALLLALPAGAGLPASPDIPPDDPLSRDVLALCLRHGDLCPGTTTRPFTRIEAARLLDAIERQWGPAEDGVDRRRRARLAAALGPELAWVRGGRGFGEVLGRPIAELRVEAGHAAGGDPYPLHGGDAAGPFLGLSWTSELVAGPFVAVAEPRFALDPVGGGTAPAGPVDLGRGAVLDMPRGYVKLGGADLELTAGISDWAWGPGRAGLLWSGNAATPLSIRFTQPHTWHLPWVFRYLGQFRFTGQWSALLGPRDDVADPYLLAMKIDYRPIPWIEASFSRLSMYGGEGRPRGTARDFWQLLWATNPHIEDDEAQQRFDANDIAALDISVMIPFANRVPLIEFLQLYWSNAGEDTQRTYLGELPLPALTGVANLGGVFLGLGPLTLRFEWARLMDDRFRWYGRHRIYHDGFHHHGRVTGHPIDGDAEGTYWELGIDPGGGIELWIWLERVRHVGVVEVVDDTVYTLPEDRRRTMVGVQARAQLDLPALPRGLQLQLRFQLEHERGLDHVPGAVATWPQLWAELRVPLDR